MSYLAVSEALAQGRAREWALKALIGLSGVRAIRHPLGFLCLPLEREGGEGVCVHLWSGEFPHAESTTSQIHCHSWDLVSYILHGRMRNVHADVVDTDLDPTHRVFEVVSGAEGDLIEPTGRTVRHRVGLVEDFATGDTYTLAAGRFHSSVVPGDGEAVTIALGRGQPGSRDLSLGPLTTPGHHVTRQPLGQKDTVRAVTQIAAYLT